MTTPPSYLQHSRNNRISLSKGRFHGLFFMEVRRLSLPLPLKMRERRNEGKKDIRQGGIILLPAINRYHLNP